MQLQTVTSGREKKKEAILSTKNIYSLLQYYFTVI